MAQELCPHMTPHWHVGVFDECGHTEDLYFRNMIYRNKQTFDTPEVRLERKSDKARPVGMAMCECDEPTPRTRSHKWTVESFEPACIKDRVIFNPCDKAYGRFGPGENNQNYTGWVDKFEDDVIDGQMEMSMARKRKEELWCAQVLQAGKYIMDGDLDYADGSAQNDEMWHNKEVIFERNENHTIIMEGKEALTQKTSVKSVGKFWAWVINMVARNCGSRVNKIVLGSAVYQKLACLDDWDKYLKCPVNGNGVVYPINMNVGAANGLPIDGVRNVGDIWELGVSVCVYDEWYTGCVTQADGTKSYEPVPYMDPYGVLFIADGGPSPEMGFGGAIHYGAIRDIDAMGLGSTGQGDLEEFVKSETKFVPSGLDVVYASKPLVMAYNIDASAYVRMCDPAAEETNGNAAKAPALTDVKKVA